MQPAQRETESLIVLVVWGIVARRAPEKSLKGAPSGGASSSGWRRKLLPVASHAASSVACALRLNSRRPMHRCACAASSHASCDAAIPAPPPVAWRRDAMPRGPMEASGRHLYGPEHAYTSRRVRTIETTIDPTIPIPFEKNINILRTNLIQPRSFRRRAGLPRRWRCSIVPPPTSPSAALSRSEPRDRPKRRPRPPPANEERLGIG
jgi:hypothetical protein